MLPRVRNTLEYFSIVMQTRDYMYYCESNFKADARDTSIFHPLL